MSAGKQTQKTINWERSTQLRTIDGACLPTTRTSDGGSVSSGVLKGVLRAIDSYCRGSWGFPSQKRLVKESGFSKRQVQRAIEVLQKIGVLMVERRSFGKGRRTGNFYCILFSDLALFLPRDEASTVTDQSATVTDQSATVALSMKRPPEAPKETPPPTPSTATATVGTRSDDTGHDWRRAAAELRSEGVRFVSTVIDAAKRGGLSPEQFDAEVLDVYRANRSRFTSPGAMLTRLRHGEWPAEGVVKPRAVHEARVRKKGQRAREAAEHRARIAEQQAWRAEFASLNAAYGAELDGMEDSELMELARLAWPTHACDFMWSRFRRDRRNSYERYLLLIAMEGYPVPTANRRPTS